MSTSLTSTPPAASTASAEVARARIAVMVAAYQVDVVVPTKFTIETFIDDLVAVMARAIDDDSVDFTPPNGLWSLARPGEAPLPRWCTLADHDVVDGTVLMLSVVESPEIFTPLVEDITDALALANERQFAEFDRDTTILAGLVALVVGAAVTALIFSEAWARSGSSGWCAAPALLLGTSCWIGGMAAGHRAAATRVAMGLALAALPLSFAGGAMLVPHTNSEPGPFSAANVAAGSVMTAIVAGTSLRSTRLGIAPMLAITAVGALLAAAALPVTYLGISVGQAAAGAVLSGLMLLTAAPRIAVVLARIRPPDLPDPGGDITSLTITDIFDAQSSSGEQSEDGHTDASTGRWRSGAGLDIESRAELAVTSLRGLIAAVTALLSGATITAALAAAGGIRATVLAAGVAGLLVLRARWHPDRVQAVSLIIAAALIVSGTAVVLTVFYHSIIARILIGLTVFGTAGAGCAAALQLPGRRLSPVTRRVVDLLEYALILVVPVLAFWIMGVYTAAREI